MLPHILETAHDPRSKGKSPFSVESFSLVAMPEGWRLDEIVARRGLVDSAHSRLEDELRRAQWADDMKATIVPWLEAAVPAALAEPIRLTARFVRNGRKAGAGVPDCLVLLKGGGGRTGNLDGADAQAVLAEIRRRLEAVPRDTLVDDEGAPEWNGTVHGGPGTFVVRKHDATQAALAVLARVWIHGAFSRAPSSRPPELASLVRLSMPDADAGALEAFRSALAAA